MIARKLWLQAFAVVSMGAVALITAPAAHAAPLSSCSYCSTSCVDGNLGFCQSNCSGSSSVTCSSGGCQAQNGTWYTYTITCSGRT